MTGFSVTPTHTYSARSLSTRIWTNVFQSSPTHFHSTSAPCYQKFGLHLWLMALPIVIRWTLAAADNDRLPLQHQLTITNMYFNCHCGRQLINSQSSVVPDSLEQRVSLSTTRWYSALALLLNCLQTDFLQIFQFRERHFRTQDGSKGKLSHLPCGRLLNGKRKIDWPTLEIPGVPFSAT